jgi:hypothetical protein
MTVGEMAGYTNFIMTQYHGENVPNAENRKINSLKAKTNNNPNLYYCSLIL